MLLANSVLWDPRTAAEIHGLSHSVDLILLGLDGRSEVKVDSTTVAFVQGDRGAGATPERQQLFKDIQKQLAVTEDLMRGELDRIGGF